MPLLDRVTDELVLSVSTITCSWVVYQGWQYRAKTGSIIFASHNALVAVWCLATLALAAVADEMFKLFAVRFVDLAKASVSPLALFLFLDIVGMRWFVTRRNVALACLPATIAFALALTNPLHGLIDAAVLLMPAVHGVEYEFTPLFQLWFLSNSALLTLMTAAIVRQALRRPHPKYRRRRSRGWFPCCHPGSVV
jgi:hypothetical protein